jgi:hypothetical protein
MTPGSAVSSLPGVIGLIVSVAEPSLSGQRGALVILRYGLTAR